MASLVADDDGASDLRCGLAGCTVTLEDILGRSVSFSEVADALKRAAAVVLDASIVRGELSPEELVAVGSGYAREPEAENSASDRPWDGRQI
jgi:hypothetical protein